MVFLFALIGFGIQSNYGRISGLINSMNLSEDVLNILGAVFVFAFYIIIFTVVFIVGMAGQKIRDLQAVPLEMRSFELRGVVFGKAKLTHSRKKKIYIVKPEDVEGHALVVGGVGSGKTSCVAIPTLRAWNDSVFAIDIKGELYAKTKSDRPNIKVFNPQNAKTYGYDPYVFLKTSHNPTQESRAIAQALIPLPHDVREPFWIKNAQNILTGAILHYFHEGLSFVETLKEIQSNSPQELIKIVSQSGNENARLCAGSFVGMADKTLSGIFSELSTENLTIVTDYEIIRALSRKHVISPADLEYGWDIYINVPEHLLRQWKTLLTLIVNQFLNFFERRDESNSPPILFMLDEFPRLGKIPAITDGLATLRSKNISICLIIQSLAQLDEIYGHNSRKVILDTCAYKAILGAKDADTQEYFSRMAGTYEKIEVTESESGIGGVNMSIGRRELERRIIKPHEFSNMADIVLFTPFDVTLTMPNKRSKKPDRFSAVFCHIDKLPYYLNEK